eukprot:scaffold4209_cov91-Isochrysis_galbana.AAC.2
MPLPIPFLPPHAVCKHLLCNLGGVAAIEEQALNAWAHCERLAQRGDEALGRQQNGLPRLVLDQKARNRADAREWVGRPTAKEMGVAGEVQDAGGQAVGAGVALAQGGEEVLRKGRARCLDVRVRAGALAGAPPSGISLAEPDTPCPCGHSSVEPDPALPFRYFTCGKARYSPPRQRPPPFRDLSPLFRYLPSLPVSHLREARCRVQLPLAPRQRARRLPHLPVQIELRHRRDTVGEEAGAAEEAKHGDLFHLGCGLRAEEGAAEQLGQLGA